MRIIIKDTIIEADANDLRQSNNLAEAFAGMLRRAFNGSTAADDSCEEEEDDQ